jgi:hypothetical protein
MEVDVNDGTADGVALEAVDKGGNRFFAGDVEGDQRRFAGSLHDWGKGAGIGLDGDRSQVLAVYGGRQYAGFAQIVDLFAGHGALGQIKFDSHVDNSSLCQYLRMCCYGTTPARGLILPQIVANRKCRMTRLLMHHESSADSSRPARLFTTMRPTHFLSKRKK